MRWLIGLVAASLVLAACGDEDGTAPTPIDTTTSLAATTTSTTTGASEPVSELRRPDAWGWLERYDLAIPTTVQYPVVTVAPQFAAGTVTVDGREIAVRAATEYHENCIIILETVRTPPDRAGRDAAHGCYLLIGLADDGSAAWIVEFWSEGSWEVDDTGLWTSIEPRDDEVRAGRLVDMVDGAYVIDAGSIRYALSGAAIPALSGECPSLDYPRFFDTPGMFLSAVIDPPTGAVIGVECEFQYSD